MDAGLVSIIGSVVGGISLILANLVGFRRENRKDHAIVLNKLENLNASVEKLDTKFEGHITDHARGAV